MIRPLDALEAKPGRTFREATRIYDEMVRNANWSDVTTSPWMKVGL